MLLLWVRSCTSSLAFRSGPPAIISYHILRNNGEGFKEAFGPTCAICVCQNIKLKISKGYTWVERNLGRDMPLMAITSPSDKHKYPAPPTAPPTTDIISPPPSSTLRYTNGRSVSRKRHVSSLTLAFASTSPGLPPFDAYPSDKKSCNQVKVKIPLI